MSEDTVGLLSDFGLTLLQAKVYVELLKLGKSRASRLATALGIIRPEAYRLLHELSAKGVVQRNLGSPSTYSALPPRDALAVLTQRYKDKLVVLSQKRDTILRSLSVVSHDSRAQNDGLTLITGGGNLILRTREMIAHAKHDYAGIRSKFGLKRIVDNGIAAALIAAQKRNVRVRLISEVDYSNVKPASYMARHVELRRSRDLLFYMDIVDGRSMVLGPAFPLTDDEVRRLDERELDLWTNNVNFVRGMYSMFDRLWENCPRYKVKVRTRADLPQ